MAVTRNTSRPSRGRRTRRHKPSHSSFVSRAGRRRALINYNESESDDPDMSEEDDVSDNSSDLLEPRVDTLVLPELPPKQTTTRKVAGVKRKGGNGRLGMATRSSESHKRQRAARGSKPKVPSIRSKLPRGDEVHQNDGVIPDWRDPRISFQCWEDIFHYAAMDGASNILLTSWLLHAATTCRAFAEPALTTLYRSPTVRHSAKAKKLAAALDRSPLTTWFNYRSKVEELHIDIHVFSPTVYYQLINPLPRLRELIIFTTLDQPPYRDLNQTIRWSYHEDIFRALLPANSGSELEQFKPFPTLLLNWEWSGRLIGGYVPTLDDITRIHSTTSFQSLARVSLTNFQLPSLNQPDQKQQSEESEMQIYQEDCAVIDSIALAISKLPSLKHLVFESSTVVNAYMLQLLPKNLTHLELVNCWEVNSEDFTNFLHSHGSSMRTLTLQHNQSLNLAFLAALKEACPDLKELNMNLSYYRLHDCVNDSDPMYEHALLPNQIPSWPHSLRVINIEHVRNWTVETAEMFLQSLIDSAATLPNLRYLAIKTMLDIPWQLRATLRQHWRLRLEEVFLRQAEPPTRFANLQPAVPVSEKTTLAVTQDRPPSLSPRNSHSETVKFDSSYSKIARTIPLRRANARGSLSYRDPDTDEDETNGAEVDGEEKSESERSQTRSEADIAPSEKERKPFYVQGRCRVVNILFDNQKVRELQYGMEDFQTDDDDDAGEEDWNGDDYEDDDPVLMF